MSESPQVSVVVPVYNEQDNIKPFLERMQKALEGFSSYEILFCLDPCSDNTEQVIRKEIESNPRIGLLVFSRRFGQPAATMAGILNCRGETCVVIDVDLQDPPELVKQMYDRYREGFEVVYARRRSRKGETWFKRIISHVGYSLINKISDVSIPRNTGDFRIISRRVIEELRQLHEGHGFLRGLVAYVGFRQSYIEYDRDERHSGTGKYNRFTGSLKIAFNGIVGFSTVPLSVLIYVGLAFSCFAFLGILYIVVTKFILGLDYPMGVPTLTVLMLFVGGIQLISLGVIGEYIGRIYDEARRRPQYIIDKVCNVDIKSSHGV